MLSPGRPSSAAACYQLLPGVQGLRMKGRDYVLLSSLSKLKEHESKRKNIRLHYPPELGMAAVEKLYEALTMCTYLFAETLNVNPRVIHLGDARQPLGFHCQILDRSFLFAYGREAAQDHELEARGRALYNCLAFEFGCLACARDLERVNQRIHAFLGHFEQRPTPAHQCATSRVLGMEPLVAQKAFNLLRVCMQRQAGVLGGCIFYRHQLVADRLPNDLCHVLAVLERVRKRVGSRSILPDSPVPRRLQGVALRQGVSLCRCYVPRAGPAAALCRCAPVEGAARPPRLCCLASRAVREAPARRAAAARPCAPVHDRLEPLVAYVEAHSDIFLCLLLRDSPATVTQALLDALYKLCFVLLRDLELCILRGHNRVQDRDAAAAVASGSAIMGASKAARKAPDPRPARKAPDAKLQFHAYTNSYRCRDDGQRLRPHAAFLQRLGRTFREDADLQRVELSDSVIATRYGWSETVSLYSDRYQVD